MGINIYNDEEKKYSKLINDLKDLPKVNAPDNFEYNLMTRISNNNFSKVSEPREQFNLIKFFAPSVVVVTVIILFFLFLPNGEIPSDDPLFSEPPQITNQSEQYSGSIQNGTQKSLSTENQSKYNVRPSPNVAVNPNDAVIDSKLKYPINRNRSVSLDDFISGQNPKRSSLQQGNIVKSGEEGADFDGFLIREEPDPKTVEKYRAMMDSVKKAEAKADSIKKAKKME